MIALTRPRRRTACSVSRACCRAVRLGSLVTPTAARTSRTASRRPRPRWPQTRRVGGTRSGSTSIAAGRSRRCAPRDREPFVVSDFPVAPGARATARPAPLRGRRARTRGSASRARTGDDAASRFPRSRTSPGTVAGEPDSRVYVGVAGRPAVACVPLGRRDRPTSGPDEARTGYVVRDSTSPANDRYDETRLAVRAEERCPRRRDVGAAAPVAATEGRPETPTSPASRRAAVIVETDQELLAKFAGDAGCDDRVRRCRSSRSSTSSTSATSRST